MSQYACKLLTEQGVYFVLFCTVLDQFTSPATESIEEIARIGEDDVCRCKETANRNVFDLRRDASHRAINSIAKLKRGRALSDDEACELGRFVSFLEATIAPHQEGLGRMEISTIKRWVKELGLHDKFPGYDWEEILKDKSLSVAFRSKVTERKYPALRTASSNKTKTAPEQYKLAGLYLGLLASMANIAGPNSSTPVQIVQKYYDKFFPE